MASKTDLTLAVSIVFAALAVGGSLVFFGFQIQGSMSDEEFEQRIDAYVAKKTAELSEEKAEEDAAPGEIVVAGDFADDDPFLGDKNAPVLMVEWSDFECPVCRSFASTTFLQLKERYIDTGKVKFVYRDFPLSYHKQAIPAANAANCAFELGGNTAFFAMHDLIFENQDALSDEIYDGFATQIGLNASKFAKCEEKNKFTDEIAEDLKVGSTVGVNGTPGFLINGRLIKGSRQFEVYSAIIEEELAKQE